MVQHLNDENEKLRAEIEKLKREKEALLIYQPGYLEELRAKAAAAAAAVAPPPFGATLPPMR